MATVRTDAFHRSVFTTHVTDLLSWAQLTISKKFSVAIAILLGKLRRTLEGRRRQCSSAVPMRHPAKVVIQDASPHEPSDARDSSEHVTISRDLICRFEDGLESLCHGHVLMPQMIWCRTLKVPWLRMGRSLSLSLGRRSNILTRH